MTKSELIEVLAAEQPQLAHRDVELAVNGLLEHMAEALSKGDRIEVRGFGSLSLHHRPARVGRNPKTGESVPVPEKHVPHFKPGRDLRERVDKAAGSSPAANTTPNSSTAGNASSDSSNSNSTRVGSESQKTAGADPISPGIIAANRSSSES